jgi:TRAP-type C4-dicarboxylate transport system permease large subunit
MLVALAALVMINVPIAIALGVIAVGAIWLTQGAHMLPNLALVMFEGATSFPLLAIPMFILAGAIMNSSSITQRLMDLAVALVGFIRGGLAHVNIVQSMFFAEISGSAVADDIWEVTKVNIWFIGVLLLVLLLITYAPPVSMVLVDLFYR